MIQEIQSLNKEAFELYEFVEFLATSTDQVGRDALKFMPSKQYHPLVIEKVKEIIKSNAMPQKRA
jgi:hypothetical protein